MRNDIFVVSCERIPRKGSYLVKFPINDQIIERIRKLPEGTAKWSGIHIAWEIKTLSLFLLIKTFKGSKKIHFDFGNDDSRNIFVNEIKKEQNKEKEKRKFLEELKIKKENWVKYKEELEVDYVKYKDKINSFLNEGYTLFPHQIIAALFMNVTRNTLIAHEMGTGKTLSSITYVEMNGFEKVVVITPNSLKFNYYNEVSKFTKSNAHVINWRKNNCSIEDAKYIIVNYDYFNPSDKKKFDKKWKDLKLGKIDAVVCDESHKLKNTASNTFKNFKRTFKSTAFRDGKESKIFLSGTPAPNRAYELYSVLNQISSHDFPTKKHFNEYYCGMTYDFENGWGWQTNTMNQKLEELFHKIAPYTHRKRKSDVLPDLPDKLYQNVILEMSSSEEKIYNDIESSVANEFCDKPTSNPLTIMVRLRQYTAHLKAKQLKDLIDNVLESGEKIVIVDYFKDSLYEINKMYGGLSAVHTGDQSDEERDEIVKEFQDPNGKIKIFLGSIQTCNYGLTLTAASKMFIISLPYSVGEYDQVADRLHRIGQKFIVNIYPLIFRDSIDEYVFDSIESKRKEILKVIDNEEYESKISESVVSEVIEKIKRKHGK